MGKTVKIIIALGAVAVTTQIVGLVIGKKLIKFSKDALASLNQSSDEESEDISFVDADVDEEV